MSPEPISPVDIEQAIKRFEAPWQRGERPEISDFCKDAGSRSSALLQALVVVDLDCRLKSGQPQLALKITCGSFPTFRRTSRSSSSCYASKPVGKSARTPAADRMVGLIT